MWVNPVRDGPVSVGAGQSVIDVRDLNNLGCYFDDDPALIFWLYGHFAARRLSQTDGQMMQACPFFNTCVGELYNESDA